MDMSDRAHIHPGLRGIRREDEPMSRHVSWRAGGRARVFYQPADVLDLPAFLSSRPKSEPLLFVGLGSNLLVRDRGFARAIVFTPHPPIGTGGQAQGGATHGMLSFRAGTG